MLNKKIINEFINDWDKIHKTSINKTEQNNLGTLRLINTNTQNVVLLVDRNSAVVFCAFTT